METTTDTTVGLDQIVRIADRIINNDDGWIIRLDDCYDTPVSVPVANSLIQGITVNALLARYVSNEATLADRLQQHHKAINQQQQIVNIICEMFWQEADMRGWCDEAADFMEKFEQRLNQAGITHLEVDTGMKEFIVEWTEVWRVERSATVMARNQDMAMQLVREEHAGEASISDLQYDSWDFSDYDIVDVTEN